jgi:hypothetical protein
MGQAYDRIAKRLSTVAILATSAALDPVGAGSMSSERGPSQSVRGKLLGEARPQRGGGSRKAAQKVRD